MKILIWAVTALLLLIWTGIVAVSTAVVSWFAGISVAPTEQQQRGVQDAMSNVPVPEWVAVWMPPAVLESMKASVSGILDATLAGVAWLLPMLGWINPLLWVMWGVVALLLLALAAVLHALVGRKGPGAGGPPAATAQRF